MPPPVLQARDLWPLAAKLPRSEQLLLARRLLRAPNAKSDAEVYAAAPPGDDEFASSEDDPMAWDADGWDEFYAAG